MPDSLVLVSVGNTRTRFATGSAGLLEPSQVVVNEDASTAAAAIIQASRVGGAGDEERRVIMASVNHPVADRLEAALNKADVQVVRFVRDVPIPITHTLDDASTVGQDRLLDAIGAFARSEQACIIIDAGTAVTVDFVDGEGAFHGGAIAPGLHMMLRALHEQTAALPPLPLVKITRELLPPNDPQSAESVPPFGKDTTHAIALGVAGAVRGLAHELIDRYATFYRAYPRVVATGGDAPLLFDSDPLIEAIVPDLTLIGMLEAVRRLDEIGNAEEP